MRKKSAARSARRHGDRGLKYLIYLTIMDQKKEIIKTCTPFTIIGRDRLNNNIDMLINVNSKNISGDIVEIGVYKGGSMLAFLLAQEKLSPAILRHYHLYDTFSGMTPPSGLDKDLNGNSAEMIIHLKDVLCISSLDEVKATIQKCNISSDFIHYHVGDILQNTFYPDKIAILRLDTDWYESTAFELKNFYDKVVSGGVVIIDDYGHWQGCKRAVDDFLLEHPEIKLTRIDYTGVYFYKP